METPSQFLKRIDALPISARSAELKIREEAIRREGGLIILKKYEKELTDHVYGQR